MKTLVFDTGPIISLATNNLLWLVTTLHKYFDGQFVITSHVKKELIDRPLSTKKFKYEALQVLKRIRQQILTIVEDKKIDTLADRIFSIANKIYYVKGNPIHIVHYAEIQSVAACIHLKAEAFAIDERTTRLLLEQPKQLEKLLSRKLHTSVSMDGNKLRQFQKIVGKIKVIRSAELAAAAYNLGLLDGYLPDLPERHEILLDSLLWGVKLSGCAISEKEIKQIKKIML